MFVSLIFPCHNEEQAIPHVLPQALGIQRELLKTSEVKGFEIIVVDDGSQDDSLKKLKEFQKEIQIISLKKQKGYGQAIKKGIELAKGDWIAFLDLDGTCQISELKYFIKKAKKSGIPIVWGNRINRLSEMPLTRKVGNYFYSLLLLCLSFHFVADTCSGFRLFKRSALTQIQEFPDDLSFSIAFTAHVIRYRKVFSLVNISYKKRIGESKLQFFKDGFVFLKTLVYYLFFKKNSI